MRIILIMMRDGLHAALEWVLMTSFERRELEALVFQGGLEPEVARWPSSFSALVAELVRRRELTRRRVASALEPRLQPFLHRHRAASPMELAELFRAATRTHHAQEMAAILWILALRDQPSTDLLCRRLAREAEVAAVRSYGAALRSGSHNGAQGSPEADRLSAIG